jgi:alkylation response protein AidB-like acyl-CoA dehydrogenase
MSHVREELRAVVREQLSKVGVGSEFTDAQLARTGWCGLEIAESLQGSGASFAEVAVVLEELGRSAVLSSYVGSILSAAVLNGMEQGGVRDALLRDVATGARRVTVMLDDPAFVVDAQGADVILRVRADGVELVTNARVTPQRTLDDTRSLAQVTEDGGEFLALPKRPTHLFNRAVLAIAIDTLGVMEAVLAATVSYVSTRTQFERPIGSFQAVKHACADMAVQTTMLRELVDAAVDAIVDEDDHAWVAVSMAKAYAGDAGVAVAGKAMQLHGGIGYTWECDVHRYLKRAMLNRALFGSPSEHRGRVSTRYR